MIRPPRLIGLFVLASGAWWNGQLAAQTFDPALVDQTRGVDQAVDYRELVQFGPWDDRNYSLGRQDLDLLSANEAELADPIPAFFRVELRKQFPHLSNHGPAQYPRAAVPLFYLRYGGLVQDGRLVDIQKDEDEGGVAEQPNLLVNGEIKLNQVLGANEVTIEINPVNPLQVIAGANNNGGQEMYYSTDGGANWTVQGTLPNTCCDPTIDWSSDGSVAYAAALSGAIGVSFWRSFDGGQNWVDRVDLTPSGSDKEFIHVDRSPASLFRDNVYVTYHNGNVMQFARSTDQGQSFDFTAFGSEPAGIGSDITTTSNGDIFYFYGAFSAQTVRMLKSTDGGASFAPGSNVAATNGSFDFPIPAMESRRAWIYAAADADRSGGAYDGNIYVAWTDTTAPESVVAQNNHTIIQIARSGDGGATWQISNPHPMGDTDDVDRFNQWIKVDENGNVHVVYYDTQHSANRSGVDLYYNVSIDGGATWGTPQRVSSETSANLTDGQEWGDYNGLSIVSALALPAWTDNRDGPPNSRDAYVALADNDEAAPTFQLSAGSLSLQTCKPDDPDDLTIDVVQVLGFTDAVSFSLDPLPAGFSGSFAINPVNPPGSTAMDLSIDGTVAAGEHVIGATATSGSISQGLKARVTVFDATPGGVSLTVPADGSVTPTLSPLLQWSSDPDAAGYTVEIDDDAGFGSIDFMVSTSATSLQAGPLSANTTYYWRVRATNACGQGSNSAVSSFTLPNAWCSSPDTAIPDNGSSVTDDLAVPDGRLITDLNVSLRIDHSYVGDLIVSVSHVDTATDVALLDRPGVPASTYGCSGDDVDALLDDDAPAAAENTCANDPALGGSLSPAGLLADFNDQSAAGTWRLSAADGYPADSGVILEWCLLFELAADVFFKGDFED